MVSEAGSETPQADEGQNEEKEGARVRGPGSGLAITHLSSSVGPVTAASW